MTVAVGVRVLTAVGVVVRVGELATVGDTVDVAEAGAVAVVVGVLTAEGVAVELGGPGVCVLVTVAGVTVLLETAVPVAGTRVAAPIGTVIKRQVEPP